MHCLLFFYLNSNTCIIYPLYSPFPKTIPISFNNFILPLRFSLRFYFSFLFLRFCPGSVCLFCQDNVFFLCLSPYFPFVFMFFVNCMHRNVFAKSFIILDNFVNGINHSNDMHTHIYIQTCICSILFHRDLKTIIYCEIFLVNSNGNGSNCQILREIFNF